MVHSLNSLNFCGLDCSGPWISRNINYSLLSFILPPPPPPPPLRHHDYDYYHHNPLHHSFLQPTPLKKSNLHHYNQKQFCKFMPLIVPMYSEVHAVWQTLFKRGFTNKKPHPKQPLACRLPSCACSQKRRGRPFLHLPIDQPNHWMGPTHRVRIDERGTFIHIHF